MKRLTAWKDGHAYYPECFEEPCVGVGCEKKNCKLETKICETLAKYEDTKLTPEQLIDIDRLYLEKCEEVERLREKQIPYKPTTPKFGVGKCKCGAEFLDKETDYCGNCGQRLSWGESDE